jgi:hypothetical protein
MDKIPLETTDSEPVARFRDCFSVRYLQAAALFSRLSREIESAYHENREITEDMRLRHEAFVLSSIFSATAFLESTINELWSDAADGAYFYADERQDAILTRIGERWKNENYFDRTQMLGKYQKVLQIAEVDPFDETDAVFQDVRSLIELRNTLMHYRREWVVMGDTGYIEPAPSGTRADKIEVLLEPRFSPNPLASASVPYFPDRCLGHGCAAWAAGSSIAFTDAFFLRLGLPAPYEGIRKELLTE